MKTQHTPGPWATTADPCVITGDNGSFVAVTITENEAVATAEDYANAHIIAAAPDLLAACETALALLGDPNAEAPEADQVAMILENAITKAKGE